MNELTTETLKNLITAAQGAGMEEIILLNESDFSKKIVKYIEENTSNEIFFGESGSLPNHIVAFVTIFNFKFITISL